MNFYGYTLATWPLKVRLILAGYELCYLRLGKTKVYLHLLSCGLVLIVLMLLMILINFGPNLEFDSRA